MSNVCVARVHEVLSAMTYIHREQYAGSLNWTSERMENMLDVAEAIKRIPDLGIKSVSVESVCYGIGEPIPVNPEPEDWLKITIHMDDDVIEADVFPTLEGLAVDSDAPGDDFRTWLDNALSVWLRMYVMLYRDSDGKLGVRVATWAEMDLLEVTPMEVLSG